MSWSKAERNSFTQESVLAENIVFRICSIHLITQSCSSYVFQNPTVPSSSLSFEPTRCIWLPQRHETKVLVDKYLTYTTYIHHIVHSPSLRALVDHVYDSLQNGTQAPMGPAIFLLALCADVTYSWTSRDEETGLFMNSEEANLQAMFWLKAALDLLDNAQRNGHASVECTQGLLLMSFVIFNLEGISARARSIISKAIVMSRELGLHRIDHPSNTMTSQAPRRTALEAEVGRRVWWYLAATDWMMARFPGPHEGTYYINPNQMAVRKPLNIDDENLTEGGDFVGLPIEEPTCMSYFLQRMRLAELSRTFSDRLGLYASSPDTTRYNCVLEIDEAIEKFIQEIPPFFTMEASELRKLLPTDRRRSIGLIVQRHIINLFVQGQRCKIHIPFFARGTVEPAYARSREVCLKTAQIILETEHELERENVTFVSTRLRLTAVLHSVFLASIALLLDLCLGTDAEVKAKSREQMAQAWRILDGAHGQCLPATRLQDLLRQVMKKNKIPLPVTTRETNSTSSMGSGPRDALPLTPSSTTNQGPSPATTSTDPPYFGSDWDNFDSGMDLDEIDWDSILLGLDAPLV
ncbi:hypothetical protein AK830_g860 [Neonectria ditissima]|uniref:Xylanolytic transcriptional activator regulatory domain-containing protein n=1 Tax=Neonectria ditissima TaxID=78410 RepID=A0A0P7BKK6_9HYPO|nr:hypothetical protein AK830_g860 [Neonectria ditissima]